MPSPGRRPFTATIRLWSDRAGRSAQRRRQRRRHDAVEQQARAGRSRTRRARRAAARRCWRRAARGSRCRATAAAPTPASKRSRCSREGRMIGIVGGREVRVDGVDRQVRRWPRPRAACVRGCRGGSRAGSCRCRSSDDSAAATPCCAAAACSARAAPGVEIVGVRSCAKMPSRSLTLSAPNTRIGARTPACRSTMPSSMSAQASIAAPAGFERARDLGGAVAVGVGLDDGDDAGARAGPRQPAGADEPGDRAEVGADRLEIDVRDGLTDHAERRGRRSAGSPLPMP